MDNNDIMVSICCLVYNHEKYLRKCLDGFIMQKTNFKFEVLIHDDASTDHSADIIREYEKKYPNIIKPIYQKENQHSKRVKINWKYQYPRVKGKYVALCEGDDYWCDENKLQMQFDIMEGDKNIALCVHKVRLIKENGEYTDLFYPRKKINEGCFEQEDMMNIFLEHRMYPFQTSSYFARAEYVVDLKKQAPDFMRVSPVGDTPLMLYLAAKGSVFYLDEEYSHYRMGSMSSWSKTNMISNTARIKVLKRAIASYILYDVYMEGKYSELLSEMIEKDVFLIYQINKNYKKLVSSKFKKQFQQLPLKERMYYYIAAYMPFLERIYRRVKTGERKQA